MFMLILLFLGNDDFLTFSATWLPSQKLQPMFSGQASLRHRNDQIYIIMSSGQIILKIITLPRRHIFHYLQFRLSFGHRILSFPGVCLIHHCLQVRLVLGTVQVHIYNILPQRL
jgi:hypothetical protein